MLAETQRRLIAAKRHKKRRKRGKLGKAKASVAERTYLSADFGLENFLITIALRYTLNRSCGVTYFLRFLRLFAAILFCLGLNENSSLL